MDLKEGVVADEVFCGGSNGGATVVSDAQGVCPRIVPIFIDLGIAAAIAEFVKEPT